MDRGSSRGAASNVRNFRRTFDFTYDGDFGVLEAVRDAGLCEDAKPAGSSLAFPANFSFGGVGSGGSGLGVGGPTGAADARGAQAGGAGKMPAVPGDGRWVFGVVVWVFDVRGCKGSG